MPKIVVSLTDSKIRSAISQHKKSPDKAIKLSDGGGLYLLIDKKELLTKHTKTAMYLHRYCY